MSEGTEWLDKEIASLEHQLENKKKLKAFLESNEIPDTIGERLKKERQLQHLSVFELSAKANVPQNDIYKTEANKLEGIPSESWSRLADTLGITFDYLTFGMTGKGERA